MGLRTYGAVVLLASSSLWMMSGTQHERALVGAGASPSGLRALEADAAARPGDPEAARALMQAYLDARQPGLAVGVFESASAASSVVRGDLRVQHAYARALVDQGRNDEALTVERGIIGACRADGEGCDAVLLASATRRAAILGELVSLGVEDTQAHPEESLVAYQNATREAHASFR